MQKPLFMFTVLLIVGFAGSAVAQQLYVFPKNGQSAEQQAKDEQECDAWARGQTGYDPAARPPAQAAAPQGGTVRGAARGAAVGAAMGAIAGNAGKGAAMGAAGGGLMGGMRRRDQEAQQNAQMQNWQAQQNAKAAEYRRAKSACLTGKGYTVQ
jgi:hypothetical protein